MKFKGIFHNDYDWGCHRQRKTNMYNNEACGHSFIDFNLIIKFLPGKKKNELNINFRSWTSWVFPARSISISFLNSLSLIDMA